MFVWFFFPQSETFQQPFTFPEKKSNCSWLQCFHFTGYTFFEKQPFLNDFFILERLFLRAKYGFVLLLTLALNKYHLYMDYHISRRGLYMLVHVSRRFPPK